MATQRLTIRQWQTHVAADPEQAVDRFLAHIAWFSHKTRRSLFAATPIKTRLLEHLRNALADPDAPLAGMPYFLQDLFDVQGLPTRCGAPFRDPFEAPLEDSSLLHRRLRQLGAAFFGKAVPAEFGVDLLGRNRTFGDCLHAADPQKIGGGGAGPAVRTVHDGLVPAAFGLDTLGGVRFPAALHGLFSFRWSNHDDARQGVVPIVPTIDAIGWATHSLADMQTLLLALVGPPPTRIGHRPPRGFRLREDRDAVSTEIKAGIFDVTRKLDLDEDLQLDRALIQLLNQAVPTLETLQARELYSVHRYWVEEYRDAYAPELLRLIDAGRECKPADADACDAALDQIRRDFTEFFQRYDYLVLPVCPQPSPRRQDWNRRLEDQTRRYLAPASLARLPVLTLPFQVANGSYGAAQILLNPRCSYTLHALIDELLDNPAKAPEKA